MLMIRARLCPCSPPGRAQPQILLEHLVHDEGAQVVGPLVDQRALDGATDRRPADGGDNDF